MSILQIWRSEIAAEIAEARNAETIKIQAINVADAEVQMLAPSYSEAESAMNQISRYEGHSVALIDRWDSLKSDYHGAVARLKMHRSGLQTLRRRTVELELAIDQIDAVQRAENSNSAPGVDLGADSRPAAVEGFALLAGAASVEVVA
jgi:hypothetical protein